MIPDVMMLVTLYMLWYWIDDTRCYGTGQIILDVMMLVTCYGTGQMILDVMVLVRGHQMLWYQLEDTRCYGTSQRTLDVMVLDRGHQML